MVCYLFQSIDGDVDILSVEFPAPLSAGAHTIVFTYKGSINAGMAGFYRSQYTSASGEKKFMACTQVLRYIFLSSLPFF